MLGKVGGDLAGGKWLDLWGLRARGDKGEHGGIGSRGGAPGEAL
jgi:hypothetical protein